MFVNELYLAALEPLLWIPQ